MLSLAANVLLLVDAAVAQNAVASASVASSPTPIFTLAPISALRRDNVLAAGLNAKLFDFGLSLIDNTHLHFPVVVSSLSSKAPITNPTHACRSFQRK